MVRNATANLLSAVSSAALHQDLEPVAQALGMSEGLELAELWGSPVWEGSLSLSEFAHDTPKKGALALETFGRQASLLPPPLELGKIDMRG